MALWGPLRCLCARLSVFAERDEPFRYELGDACAGVAGVPDWRGDGSSASASASASASSTAAAGAADERRAASVACPGARHTDTTRASTVAAAAERTGGAGWL